MNLTTQQTITAANTLMHLQTTSKPYQPDSSQQLNINTINENIKKKSISINNKVQ